MSISFDSLQIGQIYDRPALATLWGYQSIHPISRGVVTPNSSNFIILFVTKEKQYSLQQYNDYIDGNLLFWEGEDKHGSDFRIIGAKENKDRIYLFYRDVHHMRFTYYGQITLLDHQTNSAKPSEFIFRIEALHKVSDILEDLDFHSHDFENLLHTEKQALIKSRIGQGIFREKLVKLWGSCSLTGTKNISLLKASHIKSWRDSTNSERLDPYNGLLLTPNFDLLFDQGFIAFRENGQIIISSRFSMEDRQAFYLDSSQGLRKVFPKNRKYLEYHRDNVLKP